MKMSLQRALVLASMCTALPYAAHAADSTLVVVMGGEAYDGPPKFEVDFAGTVLGEGTVAAAIDTAEVGRFSNQKDKTPYVQTFTFLGPDGEDLGPFGRPWATEPPPAGYRWHRARYPLIVPVDANADPARPPASSARSRTRRGWPGSTSPAGPG